MVVPFVVDGINRLVVSVVIVNVDDDEWLPISFNLDSCNIARVNCNLVNLLRMYVSIDKQNRLSLGLSV